MDTVKGSMEGFGICFSSGFPPSPLLLFTTHIRALNFDVMFQHLSFSLARAHVRTTTRFLLDTPSQYFSISFSPNELEIERERERHPNRHLFHHLFRGAICCRVRVAATAAARKRQIVRLSPSPCSVTGDRRGGGNGIDFAMHFFLSLPLPFERKRRKGKKPSPPSLGYCPGGAHRAAQSESLFLVSTPILNACKYLTVQLFAHLNG